MEPENYQLDNLDRQILNALLRDARTPFTEIAEKENVSSGTIHVRIDKLKQAGVIKGTKLLVDHSALGYGVSAYLGINLHNARDYKMVLEKLRQVDGILEAYYTTGEFNIFTKIITKSIPDLYRFLVELQQVQEIQTTQTTMILESPILRDIEL